MKTIEIKLSRKALLDRIKTHCYYTGEARKQIGYPEQLAAAIQAGDDDYNQLNDHTKTAISEIAKLLSRFLGVCSTSERGDAAHPDIFDIIFTLQTPHNFPNEICSQLELTIENFATMRTLQLWLAQHKPDEANTLSGEVQQALFSIRELLSIRKRPKIEENNPLDKLIEI